MTEDELATIEARANASQPGPWWVVTVGKDHDDGPSHIIMSEYVSITEAFAGGEIPHAVDAEFMANARTDVVALVAEVRRLTAERDAAFTRGVEAMRDAAATYFARRSEGIEHAAAKLSCIAPTAGARIPRMSAPLTLAAIGEPERGNASDTLTRRDDAIHVSIAWRWPTNKHLAEWTVDLHAAASRIDAPDADVWTFVTRDADEAIAVFNDPEAHRLRFSLGAR